MKHLLSIIAIVLLFASCDKKKTSTNTNSASSIYVEFKMNGQKKTVIPDKINTIVAVADWGTVGERVLLITDVKNNMKFSLGEYEGLASKINDVDGKCTINMTKSAAGTYSGTFSATFDDGMVLTDGVFQNIPQW